MQKLAISLILLALTTVALADTTINYQGQLRQAGQPFSGMADLKFLLFDELTDGNQIGATLSLADWPVDDGLFQVELDFGANAFTGQVRFLEVHVDDTPLTPRQVVRPAPMALFALTGNEGPQGEPGADGAENAWGLTGTSGTDPDSNFLGTLDDQPLVLRVANVQVARFEPAAIVSGVPRTANVIAGSRVNSVDDGVRGATIAGGGATGDSFVSSASANRVTDIFGTVGGGVSNKAGQFGTVSGGRGNQAAGNASTVSGGWNNIADASWGATVGGGTSNQAAGYASTVAGGGRNVASGAQSMIPGGMDNEAKGDYGFAAGRRAKADHGGSFVWADSTDEDFVSTAANQFRVRATGGAHFETGSFGLRSFSDSSSTSGAAVQAESTNPGGIAITGRNNSDDATLVLNNTGTGRLIRAFSGGTQLLNLENNGNLSIAGTLTQNSDRNQKEAIEPVNVDDVLDRLAGLEISSWRYLRSDNGVRHIGPMAQDFHAAFGFGISENTISAVDAQGIAFAAIQGLNQRLIASNAELHTEVNALKSQSDEMLELAERNADLEKRLAALESLLLDGSQVAENSP